MIIRYYFSLLFIVSCLSGYTQDVPLGMDAFVGLLNQEISGESSKRNLEYICRLHRMRGSEEYNEAIDFIREKLEKYGYDNFEIIKIPTDGETMYGTQRSRPAWNVEFAELWELEQEESGWEHASKIADWESIPLSLAQDSHSGDVQAELVDVGRGTTKSDYEHNDVKGKLILTSQQPESVASLAIDSFGAAGIISYAQNQVTAWYKENTELIRWGHLSSFTDTKTFAFMISLKQARAYKRRLQSGEKIMLHAKVIAEQTAGHYDILSAKIEGSDPVLKDEEILYTCHLDHPRPGANDNASGSVTILEIARTLKKLIDEGKIDPPKRTMRFIWSPEIEGTTALLNYKAEFAQRTKFNIHLDMVGGGLPTKTIFHVSRGPASCPSFLNDIAGAFGEFLNTHTDKFASGAATDYPMVSKEGGKEALHAVVNQFKMGSDHQVFAEGSFRIPTAYLHDWPDRYIHTNLDVPANIDPTKLKRSAFIGLATGYSVANVDGSNAPAVLDLMKGYALERAQNMLAKMRALDSKDLENTKYYFWQNESHLLASLQRHADLTSTSEADYKAFLKGLQAVFGSGTPKSHNQSFALQVYHRNAKLKGPMGVFGYNYFDAHYDVSKPRPEIFNHVGKSGYGGDYAYEVLNLVDGSNTIADICNIVSYEFGPIPIEMVHEYLEALSSIDVVALE